LLADPKDYLQKSLNLIIFIMFKVKQEEIRTEQAYIVKNKTKVIK